MGVMRDIASEAISLLDQGKLDSLKLIALGEDRLLNRRPAHEVISEYLMRAQNVPDEQTRIIYTLEYLYKLRVTVYTATKNELAAIRDGMPDGPDRDATSRNLLQISDYIRYLRDRQEELHK